MTIVITSGGVKEKIDNVRNITNSSSGKLGLKIAKTFLEKEPNCKLIYIHGAMAEPCLDERVENIKIKSKEQAIIINTLLIYFSSCLLIKYIVYLSEMKFITIFYGCHTVICTIHHIRIIR